MEDDSIPRTSTSLNRPTISKRLRFEVFKRDGFTCRYCGQKPPDIVLEIDHIEPLCLGGDGDISNLVAACMECNRGKGGRALSDIYPRPDAELLYLETQQEIAELQRYRDAHEAVMAARRATCEYLQDFWCEISGLDWCPAETVILRMLSELSAEAVCEGFQVVAPKVADGYVKKYKWVPYLWTVCRAMEAERG